MPGRGVREAPHYLSETSYLNGEAWLALAMYAETYPHDREIAGLLQMLDSYLLARYREGSSEQFYHWGSMASAQRASMSGDQRFDDFLASLTEQFLAINAPALDLSSNSCQVVEGLASLVSRAEFVDRADPIVAHAKEWTARLMAQNLQLQIQPDTRPGQDPRDSRTGGLEKFNGGFLSAAESLLMRVEYTAHCLNALIIMDRAGIRKAEDSSDAIAD